MVYLAINSDCFSSKGRTFRENDATRKETA